MNLKLLAIYNFILTLVLTVFGLTNSHSSQETLYALSFAPMTLFFGLTTFSRHRQNVQVRNLQSFTGSDPERRVAISRLTRGSRLDSPGVLPIATSPGVGGRQTQEDRIVANLAAEEGFETPEVLGSGEIRDINRRLFLKLIGGAGFTAFFFSIFSEKAHASFFGSVPGPGTVALKDTAGNKIDPALHHPTAGYKIARMDDTSSATYAYFGFVNKTGAWYLQREQLTGVDVGQYLYSAGSSAFATAWTNRASPTPAYDTFDETF